MSELIHPFTPLKLLRHAPAVTASLQGNLPWPISVELDLSNVCNHNCGWCSFAAFRADHWQHFPHPRILELLGELAEIGVKSITFTGGGEPLVHPQRVGIFERCADLELPYGVVTNGRLLENDTLYTLARRAVFVRVSLDAGTAATHQLLHATAKPEYDKILHNIAMLVDHAMPRIHQPLTVGASFCVFDINFHELPAAAERVRATGANYLEVRPVLPTEWRGGAQKQVLTNSHIQAAQLLLEQTRQDYETDWFKIFGSVDRLHTTLGKTYQHCHIGPLTTVINADGMIYHCCQQRGMPNFAVGSVLTRKFREVWMTDVHRRMIDGINVNECPPCRYDGYNALIETCFLASDAMHSQFL